MIRVDLGKDDLAKGKSKFGKLFALGKGKGGGGRKGGKRLSGVGSGAKGIVLLGVAGALACLPHLFFEQYRAFLAEQHAAKVKETRDKIAVLEQETEKLVPYKKELESYEAQKRLVKDRIDVVRQLLASRAAPVSVLDAIGQGLPKRAWLIRVEMKLAAEKPEIILTGQAFGNEDISDYLDALQKSIFIQDATLKGVSKVLNGTLEVKQYQITVLPKLKSMAAKPAPVPGGAPVAVPTAVSGAPTQAPPPGGAGAPPPGNPGRGTAGEGM